MRYALALLTHGESETLDRTLSSFWEHVTPRPSDFICVRDGEGALPPITPDGRAWHGVVLPEQEGFCRATRALWFAAAQTDCPFVFWLEHDFEFTRAVQLKRFADVLDHYPTLAQMSLMRQPQNAREIAAGGVVADMRDRGHEFHQYGVGWLGHRAYFTTNPSLMRTDLMREHPWPEDEEQCEGRYGLTLREAGFYFGVWGDGEPWIEHIGRRDGFGY